MSIKVAIAGVGGFGYMYVDHFCRLAEAGSVEIVAAAEFFPEKWADRVEKLQAHGAKIVKSADELYQLGVHYDLVGLPVGIESHEPLTIQALEHNCNVLVEKPLSGCLQAVENIIAARNKTDRFVAVGFQHFYEPATQKVKELLCSGAMGKILKTKLMGRWPRGDAYYQRNYWAGRIFGKHAPVLDSPFCNAFAHYVNMLLYLTGSDREKAAVPMLESAELSRSRDIENFDTGIVKLLADNVPSTIMLTHCCETAFSPKLEIICEKGTVIYDEATTWQVYDANGKAVEGFDYVGKANHCYQFDAIVKRVIDPEQRICTPELAAAHVDLMEQIYKKGEIKTMPADAYTIRAEDGVRINKGLAEAWDELYAAL